MRQPKESTKDKIRKAAFALLSHSSDAGVSLSQIAKRVGISKAAIFRHYKDKAALMDAMAAYFFDDVVRALREAFPLSGAVVTIHDFARIMMRFLTDKPQYIGVIKRMTSRAGNMEVFVSEQFSKHGIRLLRYKKSCHSLEEVSGVYAFTSMVYFVLQYHADAGDGGSQNFADKVSDFLLNGWSALRDLTPEEQKACDERCVIDAESLPEEDRFFSALIMVIVKYGVLGITVERIADELGMVKSSLYSFFENKDELISVLVKTEIGYLIAALSEKLEGVTDLSCAVYVFLHVVCRYLQLRPALILIIVWHFSRGGSIEGLYTDIDAADISDGLNVIASSSEPDFGIEFPRYARAAWLASLPASLVIHEHCHAMLRGSDRDVITSIDAYDLVTQLFRQMGKALPNEDMCVLEGE
ncbi:MAG: hypothetical protein Ta2A_10760 [Treponemataceae bacterium]|nr:MAG: hypothetical protein Ta2A_10760 [Treponemataceae bacterium]